MRNITKAIIVLAATPLLVAIGSSGAFAGSAAGAGLEARSQRSAIQQADWYCGPNCQYWRHRRWEERHWRYGYYHPHYWHHHWHHYGYYHPYRYYRYGYAY